MTRLRITIETPDLSEQGVARLGDEWRALEARSCCSFFQSWTWVGCRVAERFSAPLLVRAWCRAALVGLALFNRRGLSLAPRALWLHETGDPGEDSVFIEHNGPLVAEACAEDVCAAILRAALADAGTLVLSGVGAAVRDAVTGIGVCHLRSLRPAPSVLMAGHDEAGWRAGLGGPTRAQLARSRRRLERLGPLSWRRAGSVSEAQAGLSQLAELHRRRWEREGRKGAFSSSAFMRFHQDLIARAVPRGEASIVHLAAGNRAVCSLYEFRWRGTVLAYQSGVDMEAYANTSPGLLAHTFAIDDARKAGFDRYDFLAGDARYKRSLGNDETPLIWLEVSRYWSRHGLPLAVLRRIKQIVDGRLWPYVK